MKCYLIGAKGRLGQAIAAEYSDTEIVTLERSIYQEWSAPHAADKVAQYFDSPANKTATVFVAAGLLDPNLPTDELMQVNYHLPKNIIDGASKLGIKVITFGTVMEGLLKTQNAYIQSKTRLSEYVKSVASDDQLAIHLQMHTLYGLAEPSSFMFLGHMLSSIRHDKPFKMTSGKQLREYHHLTDEAKAIRLLATYAMPGVSDISHGKPITLKAIAENVFQALGKSDLLDISALPDPSEAFSYMRFVNWATG